MVTLTGYELWIKYRPKTGYLTKFSEKGYDGVGVDLIAEKAGISIRPFISVGIRCAGFSSYPYL